MLDVSILENKDHKENEAMVIKDILKPLLDNYQPKIYEKQLHVTVDLDDSTAYMEKRHLEMIYQ